MLTPNLVAIHMLLLNHHAHNIHVIYFFPNPLVLYKSCDVPMFKPMTELMRY